MKLKSDKVSRKPAFREWLDLCNVPGLDKSLNDNHLFYTVERRSSSL